MDHIENDPSCWDQKSFHKRNVTPPCGTTHCFAGLAQILSGKPADDFSCLADAREFLGLTKEESYYYFDKNRTFAELKTALEDWYDKDGFDRYGYNKDGFDRTGYDVSGHDDLGDRRPLHSSHIENDDPFSGYTEDINRSIFCYYH